MVFPTQDFVFRLADSILVLDDKLNQKFIKFEAATHESRGVPAKKPFLNIFCENDLRLFAHDKTFCIITYIFILKISEKSKG